MQKIKKKVDTSIRVLETLKLLSKRSASTNELIKYLETVNPKAGVYTNEAIAKYINTLKVYGFKFIKDKDKFVILNALPQFKFSKDELAGLKLIEGLANNFPEAKIRNGVNEFLQDVEHRFSDDTIFLSKNYRRPQLSEQMLNYNNNQKQINQLEKYCADKLRLKLTYKSNNAENQIIAEPNDITYRKNKIYFSVYNPAKAQIQEILIDNIIKIEQLPTSSKPNRMSYSITFELKDRLANAYKLKENERLLSKKENGNIIIINQNEDIGLLLRRLMRYGENCEILSPKNLRLDMLELIKSTISNYD